MAFLQRTMNRGSVSTGYDIDNSLKLEQDNTEYLHKTPGSSGNRRTFTLSGWIKRTEVNRGSGGGDYIFTAGDGDYNQSDRTILKFNHDDTIYWGGGSAYELKTNRVFRDTSAWYHIAMIVDTTSGTAGDRLKLYVNGVRETSFSSSSNPSQNFDYAFMKDDKQVIGYNHTDSSNPMSAYIAEVLWLDGTAASITDLGEFDEDTGIWIPKDVSNLSVGTNGCYLDFEDSSNLGNDASGGTDFTLNNITAADQATDTPTNNFATMNVIWGTDRMPLMSEGATEFGNNVSAYRYATATMGVTSGKWYWEIKPTVNGNTLVSGAGIASNQNTLFFYDETGNFVYHYDGDRYVNGTAVSSYGTAWSTNDIIGFAYDADNWTLTCYVNNSSQGNLLASQTDISSELFIPYVYSFGTHTYQSNFGGYTTMSNTHTNTDENGYGLFVYAPPSGYYALCGKNLAEFGGTA